MNIVSTPAKLCRKCWNATNTVRRIHHRLLAQMLKPLSTHNSIKVRKHEPKVCFKNVLQRSYDKEAKYIRKPFGKLNCMQNWWHFEVKLI